MKSSFRKLMLVVHEKEHMKLISSLQKLGVLHLEKTESRESEETEEAIHERNQLWGILRLLKKVRHKKTQIRDDSMTLSKVIRIILDVEKEIDHHEQEIEAAIKEHEKIQYWGDFTHSSFDSIMKQGYKVFLCSTTQKNFSSLNLEGNYFQVIRSTHRDVYFILITREDDLALPIEYFPLPQKSPGELLEEIKRKKQKIKQLNEQLAEFSPYIPKITQQYLEARDKVALLEAKFASQTLADGKLYSISGWFPETKEHEVKEFIKSQNVAYLIRDPKTGDNPPVLLKNHKYPRLFEPITKIFELPNYHEADLTPFIAVFYPILFAYCLGDSGYGLLLTSMMIAGYFTFLKEQRNVAFLGVVLGVITTVMGLIKSGSLFGVMLIDDHQSVIIKFLSQFVIIPDDSDFIFNAFNVALMIGCVQILTGIIVSIYNKIRFEKSYTALSIIGKLLIVASLIWIFLADMQNIAGLDRFGNVRIYTLILGVLLVVFFHEMGKPVGKRAISSIMPLFFIFTGILGDILSYVRLFALGLASSVLGLVVNQIGNQIMSGGGFSLIIGVIFLLFGHSLNFGIAALGSFVHPLRLTFVEFYGNANFTGKGINYKPFNKSIKPI